MQPCFEKYVEHTYNTANSVLYFTSKTSVEISNKQSKRSFPDS